MVNIGARFDDRVTGRLDAFSPNSKKIHIDIEASNINKNIKVDIPIIGDVKNILKILIVSSFRLFELFRNFRSLSEVPYSIYFFSSGFISSVML